MCAVSDLHDGAREASYGVGGGPTQPPEAEVGQVHARAAVPDQGGEAEEEEREEEKGASNLSLVCSFTPVMYSCYFLVSE